MVAADIARLESEKILAGAQFELTELHVRAGRAAAQDLERDRQRMQETAAAADAARGRMAEIDADVERLDAETAALEEIAAGTDIAAFESGTVTSIPGEVGSLVEPGDPLVEIQDGNRLFMPLPPDLATRNPSPTGAAGRVLIGGETGQIVKATVGPTPAGSGAREDLSLVLMPDGDAPAPDQAAVGYVRLLPESRWPAPVR